MLGFPKSYRLQGKPNTQSPKHPEAPADTFPASFPSTLSPKVLLLPACQRPINVLDGFHLCTYSILIAV